MTPPLFGSSESAVTAEKVVRPAQKPGNSNSCNSLFPLRSIKARKIAANETPIKFAANVPLRSFSNSRLSENRTRLPATPPIETSSKDFSFLSFSWKIHQALGSLR